MRWWTALAVALSAVVGHAGVEEPLVSDRPTLTASAVVVPRDTLQLESGVTWSDDASGDELVTVGEVLARWGVHDLFELRFELGSWVRLDDGVTHRTGFDSSAVGLKVELADGRARRVLGGAMAVVVETSVPTGSSNVASDAWEPAAILAAGWSLGNSVTLGANLGFGRPDADGERFDSRWLSATTAVALADRLGAFAEVYAVRSDDPGGPDVEVMQLGATWVPASPLQLDARVGRRLGSAGPDLLLGVGAVWRIGG